MGIEDIVSAFVGAINRRDPDAIAGLMTEDHRFIDSGGEIVDGREHMKRAWIGYFGMVPDYLISISEVFLSGNTVVILGLASGTYTSDGTLKPENYWEIPAAFRAVVDGDKIGEWQVFADNEPIRQIMRRESASQE